LVLVAGRAGRQSELNTVIVQAMDNIREIFLKSRFLRDITTLLKSFQHLNSSIEPIYAPRQTQYPHPEPLFLGLL